MTLASGARLGPYEILMPIGKGGMGEVYRARDTNLDRDVAIKVLPDEVAADAERVARFEREAKLLASLNHPNIASIHGFERAERDVDEGEPRAGAPYLVLELVEGPTLAERIERGPVPFDEAVLIAKQIAEALEAGHEAGVVHRDLKPANIKLKEDGAVKVLDYGLAKALEGDTAPGADSNLSQSPTLTRQTQIGVILGTAAYMSPEQARGKRVDKRTDIFSFGVVLFEMLTGKQAFIGEDVPEVLAAIINKEPDWSALPSGLDARMERLVRRCLRKDSKLRLRDIGDARNELQDIIAEPERAAKADAPDRGNVWRAVALISIAIVAALVAAFITWTGTRSDVRPTTRLAVTLPAQDGIETQGIAISPDGADLVYSATRDGVRQLFRRSLRSLEAVPIAGTEEARYPFFSPDGRSVGFFADYDLRTVPLNGGPVVTLGFTGYSRGASWAPDDAILYATIETRAVMRVPATGGEPEPVTALQDGEVSHRWPHVLPEAGALLFSVQTADEERVAVQSLGSGEHRVLLEGTNPRYVSAGYLVFSRSGSLWGAPFDVDRLELAGPPAPLLEDVAVGTENGIANFGVSDDGSLVYIPTGVGAENNRQFVWVDRAGRDEVIPTEPQPFDEFTLSPDGTRVAVRVSGDVWIYDLKADTWTRLSPGVHPAWSHDGRRVAFRRSGSGMSWKAADGTGEVELLLLESPGSQYPQAFSPDGATLVFEDRRSGGDLGMMSLQGERIATFLLDTDFQERTAALSPDGRWLAYESNESGRTEVYVRPFPDVDSGRWPVSNSGGRWPLWSADGRELFYVGPESLIAVGVETEPTFTINSREPLFDTTPYRTPRPASFRRVALAPDGRFLLQKDVRSSDGALASPSIIVVQGWFHELERLVPSQD